MSTQQEFLTCRGILIILFILGFMLHHILRINISIAIIDMLAKNDTNLVQIPRYTWTEVQKNDILGCFYLGYCIGSLISGPLSEQYGTRKVMGCGLILGSFCTLLTHVASSAFYFLIAMRTSVGLALGIEWSSVMPLATKWIAPNNISKFMSNILASQLGAAISLLCCGLLIDSWGWPSVFYATGTIGIVWCIAWFYWVYDSPAQHPRISKNEREEIENEVKYEMNDTKRKKPWIEILTSMPVWAIIVANTCLMFNVNALANYMPLYMEKVLHFSVKQNGFLSSLPFVATYGTAVLGSYVADRWRKTNRFSLLTIRRIFTVLGFLVPVVLLLTISVWGYNRYVSVVVFILWQAFMGFPVAGHISNPVDISPSYSGTIHGMATGFGGLTGYFSTKIFSQCVGNEENFEQWRALFLILAGAAFFGCVFYLVFGSAEVQKWNVKKGTTAKKCDGELLNSL